MAAMGGSIYSMAADDYIRFRIRHECQRVGCTEHTTVIWCMWDEQIKHGDEVYHVAQGPYESAWQGIVGWLDQQHAPLITERQAQAYPDPSMS